MRNNQSSKTKGKLIEKLEARQLLTAAQLSYSDFSSTAGIASNGYGSSAVTASNHLVITDGNTLEARSDIFTTKVPIDSFTSHFSYQTDSSSTAADGVTFVVENDGTTALGANGFHLAYANGTFGADSEAVALNSYNLGAFGSTVGFATGGANATNPVDASPIDFHSGDIIDATVTYDGTTLTATLVDTTTQQTFTDSAAVNLPQLVGGHKAYVGFTGSTGNDFSTQSINNFDFTGTPAAPTVTLVARSSPTVVTGTKAHLSVTAVSNTSGTLSYAWTLTHVPTGAPTPTIKPNNSTSSNAPTAHFFKDGTYRFRVTVTDSNGGSTVSDLTIVVQQTATVLKIAPHKASIKQGSTEQFVAKVYDQFGHVFRTEPGFAYAVETGSGSIGASSGLYSASGAIGHLVISATADDLDGIAGAVVVS